MSSESPDPSLPGNFKAQLLTQSPGIVLVTLGTVLMLLTILIHQPIQVNDAPVYTSVTTTATMPATSPKPADLNLGLDIGKLEPPPAESLEGSARSPVDQTTSLLEQARKRHLLQNPEASK